MRRYRSAAGLAGMLLVFTTTGHVFAGGGGAEDELIQLRRQLAEQRRDMETLEKRLLELEGKDKQRERTVKGLEAGYEKGEGVVKRRVDAKDIYMAASSCGLKTEVLRSRSTDLRKRDTRSFHQTRGKTITISTLPSPG